jgi:two-component system nitrogen regulation response regulator GlnG
MLIMSVGNEILPADLPAEISQIKVSPDTSQNWQTLFQQTIEQQLKSGQINLYKNTLPEIEKTLITAALTHTNGHRQEAAQLLGIGRNTLTRRIKELEIET